MSNKFTASRSLTVLLSSCLLILCVQTSVFAGIVTTSEIVNAQQTQQERDRLQQLLARDDVRKALTAQGVDAVAAKARVASMTDSEIQTLAANMGQLPAGGRLSDLELILLILLIVILI
jgi:hypothetical protein